MARVRKSSNLSPITCRRGGRGGRATFGAAGLAGAHVAAARGAAAGRCGGGLSRPAAVADFPHDQRADGKRIDNDHPVPEEKTSTIRGWEEMLVDSGGKREQEAPSDEGGYGREFHRGHYTCQARCAPHRSMAVVSGRG